MSGFRCMPVVWVVALAGWSLPAEAGWEWGGCATSNRAFHLRVNAGAMDNFEGMVTETTRKLYDVTGAAWSQADAESYNLNDFNLGGPFGAFGLSCEMDWSLFRFQLDTTFVSPSTEATARRDYYLTVDDDIAYGGETYDHLMIPAGTPFSADLTGNLTELTCMIVPFGYNAHGTFRINPSLDVGLLFFGGNYEIDAGAPSGVRQYQNPPEDFVIGGRADGFVALATPQWGPGLDLRFGPDGGINLDLQVHYLFCEYSGSTAFFTSADHREKDVDFTHENLRVRAQVEFPMRKAAWNLGVQFQMVDTDGTVTSKATDPAEILARRERFDKEFVFEMSSVMATIGLTF